MGKSFKGFYGKLIPKANIGLISFFLHSLSWGMTSGIFTRTQSKSCHGRIGAEPEIPPTKGRTTVGNQSINFLHNAWKMRENKSENERCKRKRVLFLFFLRYSGRGDNHGNKLTVQRQINPGGKQETPGTHWLCRHQFPILLSVPQYADHLTLFFTLTLTYTGAVHCLNIGSSQFSVLSQMPWGWWIYIFFLDFNLNI